MQRRQVRDPIARTKAQVLASGGLYVAQAFAHQSRDRNSVIRALREKYPSAPYFTISSVADLGIIAERQRASYLSSPETATIGRRSTLFVPGLASNFAYKVLVSFEDTRGHSWQQLVPVNSSQALTKGEVETLAYEGATAYRGPTNPSSGGYESHGRSRIVSSQILFVERMQ